MDAPEAAQTRGRKDGGTWARPKTSVSGRGRRCPPGSSAKRWAIA